jgi:endonuclease-3
MTIATILSQNTNDRNSYKAFENLKTNYKNWGLLRTAKRTVIESKIKVAG